MATISVDIDTLKRDHPGKFDEEYERWAGGCHHGWWDGVYDLFVERMKEFGVEVSTDKQGAPCIYFSLGYCQSDYAAFEAQINLAAWMRAMKHDEQFPALVEDMDGYGAYGRIGLTGYRGGYSHLSSYEYNPHNVRSSGIFEGLPEEAWDALVDAQSNASTWEKGLDEWIQAQCQQLYRDLQTEFEYQTSEEQFVECVRANEYQFDVEIEDEVHCED